MNIDAVSSLIKCEQLWVARNAIATVPSLKLLTELRFINLESNRIVNIDAIGLNDTHVHLTCLLLGMNRITNIEALEQ